MKTCSKCGETKPLDGFYRDRRARDGLTCQCKACRGLSNTAWEQANPDRVKARCAQQIKLHPEKRRARLVVGNAIRGGKIAKPERCGQCGEKVDPDDLHAHHVDYSKPLEVDWLCRGCHNALHR
jgi:hypothetical protein